jgi:hypothetical protein
MQLKIIGLVKTFREKVFGDKGIQVTNAARCLWNYTKHSCEGWLVTC